MTQNNMTTILDNLGTANVLGIRNTLVIGKH